MEKSKFYKPVLHFILITLLLLFFILVFQGSRGLWEPDEGRYANVALNMLTLHNFLIPYINDETPHFNKPPLTYWAIAGCIRLFGRNEWAVRLPNALAFCGIGILIYIMGLRLVSQKPWLALLVYATSVFPYVALNIVTVDTILTFCETLAVFGFLSSRWSASLHQKRIGTDTMWIGFGLAFLTKGPPGLLPFLAILIYIVAIDGLGGLKQIVVWEGLLGFLIIGFGWYFVVIMQNNSLLTFFFQDEFINRIATGVHNRHYEWYGPLAVYLPIVIFGSFPWIVVVSKAIRRYPRLFQREYWRIKRAQDPEGIFLMLWLVLPLMVFCLAKSRLPLYILPIFVPIAIIIGRQLQSSFDMKQRPLQIALLTWIFCILAAKYALSITPYSKDSRALAHVITQYVKEPLEDIVFVDKAPYYGLKFYLGIDVERVTIFDKTLSERNLKEEEPLINESSELNLTKKLLFIVPEYNFYSFIKGISKLGYKTHFTGHWNNLYFFYLNRLKRKNIVEVKMGK